MKKMTQKEFKEIFNQIADFDIYGWEGILGLIERACWENGKQARENGCISVYKHETERANIIHDILEERGYYDI